MNIGEDIIAVITSKIRQIPTNMLVNVCKSQKFYFASLRIN